MLRSLADYPASAWREDVPLAPLTTLELGGRARFFADVRSEEELARALARADAQGLATFVLGGGSNLLVSDEGFDGLVLAMGIAGVREEPWDGRVLVTAGAGEPWDDLVRRTVGAGLAGLECLSGIPGSVGATPVQNVGAYGQEVADTLVSVRVLERATGRLRDVPREECDFAYRDSRFKREPGRFVVVSVSFALAPGGAPAVRYAELARALEGRGAPSLAEVRETVIALRRGKSMVLDPSDENRRSAGSFFTNPIVPDAQAQEVVTRALALGVVERPEDVPRWPAGEDRTKLAAGWLIERSGVGKGLRRGAVGVSSRHALALVHHGGGTAAALVALALEIRGRVEDRFGVRLEPEPVRVGFAADPFA